ncbi:hypothetical protein ACP3T3_20190 [Chryseobacterium sp. CBSDS_008]|uniref:hypothetical protein n=1 Tax=Chryseobacterium sp. CBSDS_008 TaxID=3415265 RepID=UPI003CF20911
MKNLRIDTKNTFLALAIFAVFSFATNDRAKFAVIECYVNPDGSRGAEVVGPSFSEGLSQRICSQEYDTITNQPTGNPI